MSCSGSSGELEGQWMAGQLHPVIHSLRSGNCTNVTCLIHSLSPWPYKYECRCVVELETSCGDPLQQYNPGCRNILRAVDSYEFTPTESFLKRQHRKMFPCTPSWNQHNGNLLVPLDVKLQLFKSSSVARFHSKPGVFPRWLGRCPLITKSSWTSDNQAKQNQQCRAWISGLSFEELPNFSF